MGVSSSRSLISREQYPRAKTSTVLPTLTTYWHQDLDNFLAIWGVLFLNCPLIMCPKVFSHLPKLDILSLILTRFNWKTEIQWRFGTSVSINAHFKEYSSMVTSSTNFMPNCSLVAAIPFLWKSFFVSTPLENTVYNFFLGNCGHLCTHIQTSVKRIYKSLCQKQNFFIPVELKGQCFYLSHPYLQYW